MTKIYMSMDLSERFRLYWQRITGEEDTPFDGETYAWLVSMIFHVVILLFLSLLFTHTEKVSHHTITITQLQAEPIENEVLTLPEEMVIGPKQESISTQDESFDASQSLADQLADVSEIPIRIDEVLNSDIRIDTLESDSQLQGLEFTEGIPIRGDSSVGTTGALGAVDRLTLEIMASLEQRPTLIVWVFDQSVSLSGQRREISERLVRVFDELGTNRSSDNRPDLTNMVFAYGKNINPVVLKPTRECEDVVGAINSIPVDESGIEMTFTAIAEAAKAAKVARINPSKRNVMIIVFTDEIGNDEQGADQVANFCRVQAMRVFVVGVPAPFGRRQVQVRFVEFDSKYADDEQFPVVDQGPETLFPEVVQIKSSGVLDEPMDSGFGPYSLSKVCAETGGIYFCVHANRDIKGRVEQTAPMASRIRYFFDNEVMRQYRPEYLPAAKVEQLISSNKAKKALVDAARSSMIFPMESPRTVFPREDDGKLSGLLSEAQKNAAVLAPKIDAIYGILIAGQTDRDKIHERRWQAGYDLAMGRILAAKIRTDSYNIMLAQAKSGMKFKNSKNDTWKLIPSEKVSGVGSQTEKLTEQAIMYLNRVVRDHPGTPWALIAQQELKVPFGYEWQETHTGVNAPKNNGGGGNENQSDDKKRNIAPPKPKRPLKNL